MNEKLAHLLEIVRDVVSRARPFVTCWEFDPWDYDFDGEECHRELKALLKELDSSKGAGCD
jgi:hypothetical protein